MSDAQSLWRDDRERDHDLGHPSGWDCDGEPLSGPHETCAVRRPTVHTCAGCSATLRSVSGLMTCDTARCPGNLIERGLVRPKCDTCRDTGRMPWMIEGDPNCYQTPDDDGMIPCIDCTPREEEQPMAAGGTIPSGPIRGEKVAVVIYDEADPMPANLADRMRLAVSKALAAHYEPTGLILHPVDDAQVRIDPNDPETIEHAKRIADAFGVPYWLMGIPGYRAPLRARLRGFLRMLPRRALTAIPGVERLGPRYTGPEWYGETRDPRAGRWFVHVGNYRIGVKPEEEDWDV